MVKYHYILWGLYLYVNSGDKAVFAFLAAAEGAAVKLLQHENETLCDTHHITVHHWRAAQLRQPPPPPRLCGATSVAAPWLGPGHSPLPADSE